MDISDVNIIRSDRKTLAIQITEGGSVVVRAPRRASERFIQRFLTEKDAWIRKSVASQLEKFAKRPTRRFEDGETFLYLGEEFDLCFDQNLKRSFVCDDAFRVRHNSQHKAKDLIQKWYKREARAIFNDRAAQFSTDMRAPYSKIRLSSAKTRWGSCSARDSLNFNWRLVMAPIDVIDSVIVHELAHVHHKNHGKRFWNLVLTHCPDYKTHDKWLKENRALLTWD